MQDKTLLILIALTALAVLVVLLTGIGGLAQRGDFNRRNGNRLMRWRIILQAAAVALIMLLIWLRGH